MSTPAKHRIILGHDNCMKLILPSGIPDYVDSLKFEIQKQCGIKGEFRLQYMENYFDQFMNLTSTADIQDKGTVKVIIPSEQSTGTQSYSRCTFSGDGWFLCRHWYTDIFWVNHLNFSLIPNLVTKMSRLAKEFPYSSVLLWSRDAAVKVKTRNSSLKASGWTQVAKSGQIFCRHLASEIMKYTTRYPTSAQWDDVGEALIMKHPCLKGQGSVTGYNGWKISLKYKMGNNRTKLRSLGCPEMRFNSMKNRWPNNQVLTKWRNQGLLRSISALIT